MDSLLYLWLNIFNGLETKLTRVQIKPESNSLTFITKFELPFFYEVYKFLDKKYQELLELDDKHVEIHEELFNFILKARFGKKSRI